MTNRVNVADGFVDFTPYFKYLGSYVSFDLTDDYDIDVRISKASQMMGALKLFWRNQYVDLKAKKQIFQAISLNLLLWGCEAWAFRESQLNKLDAFLHR